MRNVIEAAGETGEIVVLAHRIRIPRGPQAVGKGQSGSRLPSILGIGVEGHQSQRLRRAGCESPRCITTNHIGAVLRQVAHIQGWRGIETQIVVTYQRASEVLAEFERMGATGPGEVVYQLPVGNVTALRPRRRRAEDGREISTPELERRGSPCLSKIRRLEDERVPRKPRIEVVHQRGAEGVRVAERSSDNGLRGVGVEDRVHRIRICGLHPFLPTEGIPDPVVLAHVVVHPCLDEQVVRLVGDTEDTIERAAVTVWGGIPGREWQGRKAGTRIGTERAVRGGNGNPTGRTPVKPEGLLVVADRRVGIRRGRVGDLVLRVIHAQRNLAKRKAFERG